MARRWDRKLPRSHPRLARRNPGIDPALVAKAAKEALQRAKLDNPGVGQNARLAIPAPEFNTATGNRRTARSNRRSSRILNKFLHTNSRNSHALLKALLILMSTPHVPFCMRQPTIEILRFKLYSTWITCCWEELTLET